MCGTGFESPGLGDCEIVNGQFPNYVTYDKNAMQPALALLYIFKKTMHVL
jgi:hypothetical protein